VIKIGFAVEGSRSRSPQGQICRVIVADRGIDALASKCHLVTAK